MKNPYQDEQFYTTVDIFTLPDDLRYGYQVFRQLLTQQKKSVVPLHEIQEDRIQENKAFVVTFKKINHKFNAAEYESLTEVTAELRKLLEDMYKYLGSDHYLFKNTQTLERVLEQKIALLPRVYRDKCSIEATNIFLKKEFLNAQLYSNRRRGGKAEGNDTPILFQMKHEKEIVERERKQQKEEEKRQKLEKLKEQYTLFESEILTRKLLKELRTCWEIPCVGIFVHMLQDFFDIQNFNYTEFELGTLFIERSSLFAKLLAALLSTPHQRVRYREKTLNLKKPPKFEDLFKKLSTHVTKWYNTADYHGLEHAVEKYGLCPSFFKVMGEDNPLTEDVESFTQLDMKQKMTIVKALCEATINIDDSMCQCLASVPLLQRQDLYLGQDNEKHSYYFFPQFNNTDIRIFKKYHQTKSSKSKNNVEDEYELVAWDVETLDTLVKKFQKLRKSKNSYLFDLQQTLEALYEELSSRENELKRIGEKAKLAFLKDYLAEEEDEEETEESIEKDNKKEESNRNDDKEELSNKRTTPMYDGLTNRKNDQVDDDNMKNKSSKTDPTKDNCNYEEPMKQETSEKEEKNELKHDKGEVTNHKEDDVENDIIMKSEKSVPQNEDEKSSNDDSSEEEEEEEIIEESEEEIVLSEDEEIDDTKFIS